MKYLGEQHRIILIRSKSNKSYWKNCQVCFMNTYPFYYILLITCLSLIRTNVATLEAQTDFRFQHVSEQFNLSSDAIYCITQDHEGFIWIGTEDGLNRFNGYEMVTFRHHPEVQGSISSNWVFTIYEDHHNHLWLGTKIGANRLDPDTGKFKEYNDFHIDSATVRMDDVYAIYQDSEDVYWFGGTQLFRLKSPNGGIEKLILPDNPLVEEYKITFLKEDNQGRLLIGTTTGLYRKEKGSDLIRYLGLSVVPEQVRPFDAIRGYRMDSKDNLWVAGRRDILHLDLDDNRLDTVARGSITNLNNADNIDIIEDAYQRIWVTSGNGLKRIDPSSGAIMDVMHDPKDPNSLAKGVGSWLFTDLQGSLWIGGGIGLDFLPFQYLDPVNRSGSVASFAHRQISHEEVIPDEQKMIRCFLRDREGHLWVGTYDGLFRFPSGSRGGNPDMHYHHEIKEVHSLSGDQIRALLEDRRGDIWVATTFGLNRIDHQTGVVDRIPLNQSSNGENSDKVLWSLLEDDLGNLWIGSMSNGIFRLDSSRSHLQYFRFDPKNSNSLSRNEVLTLFQDSGGRIWVGTFGGGLNLFQPSSQTFTNYRSRPLDPGSLSGDVVWSIFEDGQSNLWIGTQNGLNKLIPEKDTFRFERYLEEDGLVNNTVYGILSDESGRLWLSTLKGLSCFDPVNKSFLNFGVEDGLQALSFTPNAYYKDSRNGDLYFGGVNGYNCFRPANFRIDTFAPPVVISSLTRFNRKENNGQPIIDYFPAGKNIFRLSYQDNILLFDVSLLNYQQTQKNKYEYLLEGIQPNWISLGSDHKITLTDLKIGKHMLHLRGTNHHGIHTSKESLFTIIILPPWWWTTMAKILYLILLLAGILFIYRYLLNKRLVEQEAQQLKEMDELKSRFFTNISHEFRTPLTVISGMVSQIKQQPEQWLDRGMELIQRNSQHLLSLINQILDLRKLESGAIQIHLIRGNIIPYFNYIADSFQPLALSKQLRIHFLSSVSEVEMDYDPDKMLQILSNLISNAIKYTPGPGDIYLQIDRQKDTGHDQIRIKIKDTGPGIAAEDVSHIFEYYYQAAPQNKQRTGSFLGGWEGSGSGVGLALTRELVHMMKGAIQIASEPGIGTEFTLTFPIFHTARLQESKFPPAAASQIISQERTPPVRKEDDNEPDSFDPTGLPVLLIVEDNPDVRQYLQACLGGTYQLLMASDGNEGINKAIEQVPDIIVSDVMMPVKDGFILCDTLKNDERTSHIPIVLLTARADYESRIAGLRKGADVYLAKPFEEEELMVQLERLLQLREKIRERYRSLFANATLVQANSSEDMPHEDAFLNKFRMLILDHLTEEDFGVPQLCRHMGLGRTQLHNKIKALTGHSTTALVRSIRLHQARMLLQTSDLNVSEVSYAVGIGNPAYFSRIYSDEFGEAPRETRQ